MSIFISLDFDIVEIRPLSLLGKPREKHVIRSGQ